MIRVVIDTNVVVSAAISHKGPPAAILDLVAAGEIVACVSPALLAEYEDVLTRPNPHLDPLRVQVMLKLMPRIGYLVTPSASSQFARRMRTTTAYSNAPTRWRLTT